jgi:hypothetical protein
MSNFRTFLRGGVLAFLVFIPIMTTPAQTEDDSVNGLLMSPSHDESAIGLDKAMHFVVTFRNLGTENYGHSR